MVRIYISCIEHVNSHEKCVFDCTTFEGLTLYREYACGIQHVYETQPHRTIIGFGSTKEGSHDVHGAPLKPDDMAQMKERFGLPAEPFTVKDEVCACRCWVLLLHLVSCACLSVC